VKSLTVAGTDRQFGPAREHQAVWPGVSVRNPEDVQMNGVIYLVGLVVIVLAILSLFGLR
jgi:hypothetical protein